MQHTLGLVALAAGLAALAPHARADEQQGTRPYLVDATFAGRRGEVAGWNVHLFGGAVVLPDLVPSRHDRTAYVAIGLQAGRGELYPHPGGVYHGVPTWSLGPELRLGLAWGSRRWLRVHTYVAVSPLWQRVGDDPMLRDRGDHAGARVALGVSFPSLRRSSLGAAGDAIVGDGSHADYGSASSGMEENRLMFGVLCAAIILVLPDTIEVTYERAGGVERTGLALGYSL